MNDKDGDGDSNGDGDEENRRGDNGVIQEDEDTK